MAKPRNDRSQAVTKFCLAMEEHRRTEAGRVRTAKEFVMNFFPYDEKAATDKVFHTMPNEVRGPVLSAWGIRGSKAALKDDNDKVREVVHDALVAGDIDESIVEDGLSPQILVDWIALGDWWSFWRQGKLTGVAIQKALATARELELIDDRWFFLNVQGRGGKLKGTDVVCDTLSKDQIVSWIRKLHESGDGSPAGLVSALGWETILAKTAQDALLFALDAFAKKTGLVSEPAPPAEKSAPKVDGAAAAKEKEPPVSEPMKVVEKAIDSAFDSEPPAADSAPEIPIIDGADGEPTTTQTGAREALAAGESPKLVEARAKMMEMLGGSGEPPAVVADGGWGPSEVPAKPSSLEWGEAPPVITVDKKVPPIPRR